MAAPAITFFTRGKEQLQLFGFDTSKENALAEKKEPPFPLPTPKAVQWSPDGQALVLVEPTQGVQVIKFARDADNEDNVVQSLHSAPKTTQGFLWSPRSSALATMAPGSKSSTEPNLHVWRRDEHGSFGLEASFLYPKLEKSAKVLQWSPDEAICARLLPEGRVHVLSGADLSGAPLVDLKLSQSIVSFEFAPVRSKGGLKGRLCVFKPDVRDDLQRVVGPAEVVIYELTSDGDGLQAQDRARSSVASGQVAELMWNSTGSALIAHCQTEVDESGQSYYGGSKLVLLSSDGEYHKDLMEGEDGIPLTSGTAVQAVAWSPTRDEFILIHGFQPSQASLFAWDEQAKKVTLVKVLLEKAHRNTIRFNHFGSLVCLAGFGNLAGQVDFFGRAEEGDDEKCDFVRISNCVANCTVSAEWAPDGRHFLTSVLAPRMRVDNGAFIWHALTGTKVAGRDFEELLDAQWRPEPLESLTFLDLGADEIELASKDLANTASTTGGTEKKQAYRPPKARGEGSSTVAAMMRGEVAAPEEDRRRRQPRRVKEEEPNASPRRDEPPWAHAQQERERSQREQAASGLPDAALSPAERALQAQAKQQFQQQQPNPRQDRERSIRDPAASLEGERGAPSPDRAAKQQQQQQQQAYSERERQWLQAQVRAQEQQAQLAHQQQQAQREQQQREQQQREQLLQQQQQRAAQQREARSMALHTQMLREQYEQQQAPSSRPPPPSEVPPSQQANAIQVAEAARLAAAAGYPGSPQRVLTAQQQQQQAQQAAYGRQAAAMAGQQQQQHLAQHYQQQQQQQALEHQRQLQQQQAAAARAAVQQHATQGISAHGQKLPCPATGWEYTDPKGRCQGPFSLAEMQGWHQMGYFRPELPMRCDPSDRFVPFGELFPHPQLPFQSYPKRPQPGGPRLR